MYHKTTHSIPFSPQPLGQATPQFTPKPRSICTAMALKIAMAVKQQFSTQKDEREIEQL